MLLTRAPLPIARAFDLHVLGLPPAFVLSQDQTLKLNSIPLQNKDLRRDILCSSKDLNWCHKPKFVTFGDLLKCLLKHSLYIETDDIVRYHCLGMYWDTLDRSLLNAKHGQQIAACVSLLIDLQCSITLRFLRPQKTFEPKISVPEPEANLSETRTYRYKVPRSTRKNA